MNTALADTVDDAVVVLVAEISGDRAGISRTATICSPAQTDTLRTALLSMAPEVTVAQMWPVAPGRATEAMRWAERALRLAHDRTIAATERTIDCTEHAVQLWIAGDSVFAGRLATELLAPLLTARQMQFDVLGPTLLRWLQTHDSAPDLAQYFGVHPQTIRYRQRTLMTMFGDRLEDPDESLALILALKTILPSGVHGVRPSVATPRPDQDSADSASAADQASSDLLAPLLAARQVQIDALAPTLLRWLETGDSTTELAKHFGLSWDATRKRQYRLTQMFGEQLDDPDRAAALIAALRATFPSLE